MTSFTKPTSKPRGWDGHETSLYWTKHDRHGMHAICTDCGRKTRGWARDDDRSCHWDDCPRLAGPRKEWRAGIGSDGRPRVDRFNIPSDYSYETREAALLALDAELQAKAEAIARQRAHVAAMLKEEVET